MSRVHRGPRALAWLLNALGQPTRRKAYEAVREARRPMSRADVAQKLGIGVRLAAFHLDKLVDEGLLTAHYARQEGRKGGPGSGRPPKWYAASPQGFDISMPPRRHDIAATILLRSLAGPGGGRERLLEEARSCGRGLAEKQPGRNLESLLSHLGYEPVPGPGRCVDLLNCPFHELVEEDRDTVCAMNLAFLQGATEAGADSLAPVPERRAGFCCVKLVPEMSPGPPFPKATAEPSV